MLHTPHDRKALLYIVLAASVLLLFILDVFLGSSDIRPREILAAVSGKETDPLIRDLVLSYRLPKALTALLSGVALSVCGLQMQTLFRNPLADPYILGISSGSGLGVAIFLMGASALGAGADSVFMSLGAAGSAFVGAALVTLLIISISGRLRDNLSLLIFGVMIGFIASAMINLLQYFSSSHALKSYVVWSMGSFAGLSAAQLSVLAAAVAVGLLLSVYNIKDLNALLLGEQYAVSVGVSLAGIRIRILAVTALLAGSVTAFCGPVGFIGIAAPHIARAIYKDADHRITIPAAALVGACAMLLTDVISCLPGRGGIIPVNTVASLLGIPVILVILLKRRQ
ncbi:MAG: iron ABC transporter permease [Bacteroidales bacterium]|nr:iron ABC transporter permease [Bacteroidales bacterium]MCI2145678.1 iron ABC transporter permease [Bacteroidales bacterium]